MIVTDTGMMTASGKSKASTVNPVEVQQTVLRFADEFSASTVVGIDKLRRGTNALDPAQVLKWKISLVTETCSIVSGPNALADLVDMTVFITAAQAAMEEHWQPNVFGESAQPLLESWRNSETNIWRYTDKLLTPDQRTELRAAIETWRRQNPLPEGVLAARAVGFASQGTPTTKTESAKPNSVFNLLMLDPLAGMDPAVREIAQSRMFAERALYVTQKMPMLLRWQTELLSVNALRLPAVEQLVTNSTQLTSSVESFARLADQLPKMVNDQRQAAIQQVFDGIAVERTNLLASLAADDLKLRATLVELRQTLEAGNELVKSSDTTVKSLDTFMARFDKGTNAPTTVVTNARPFDILDYAVTAKAFTTTIKELNTAVASLDQTLPRIQQATDHALNRLFLLSAGLILLLLVGATLAALAYRRLAHKG